MLFLVSGIILFSAFNVLAFYFVRKAGLFVAIEKKLELSGLYSELNKYFVSAIVVFAVFILFFLRKAQLGLLGTASLYFALSLAFMCVLGYWLYVELKRRNYSLKATQFMLISNALKNLGFISIIYGIAQFLAKFK